MSVVTYTLEWPRPLFDWEVARVSALNNETAVAAIDLLVSEAFSDDGAADDLRAVVRAAKDSWTDTPAGVSREWLARLGREVRLEEQRPPVYYAEREGFLDAASKAGDGVMFSAAFVELIVEMQDRGYFPRALPRWCPDDEIDWSAVTRKIRSATRLDVEWPPSTWAGPTLEEATVLTLIEYFHDQAQRPRVVTRVHEFDNCGPHYGRHNGESGGVVYRWRMNALLASYRVGFRLGATGDEKGRLIRRFNSPIDELADRQIAARQTTPNDEVAHAIREFRKRDAGLAEKRSSIRALSHALEPRRKRIGILLTKGDESDLFQIVNRFGIRHNNDSQHTDYGDEFLDWVFWMHLATIELLGRIAGRDRGA